MPMARKATVEALCLAAGIFLGAGVFTAHLSTSYAQPVAGLIPLQYMTATVDANSLEAKVGDLARDNWEIFSITTASSVIDQAVDGKTHIVINQKANEL